MRFDIERLDLTDADGLVIWPDGPPPRHHGYAEGADAREALVAAVASVGDVHLDIAHYADGQALVIVKSGIRLYALRAVPRGMNHAIQIGSPLCPMEPGDGPR